MVFLLNRCSVCESTTRVIAIHSQAMAPPNCPNDWSELWIGYSYLMVRNRKISILKYTIFVKTTSLTQLFYQSTVDNSGGFGQNLVSPGSCLKEFRANPVIECHDKGVCNYYDQVASFWLSTIEQDQMFQKPRQQTLKADLTSRVSR